MLILETPRLLLRQFEPADADALAQVLTDPETMRYYPAPLDRAGVEQWIARNRVRYVSDHYGLWAMVLRETGELVGDCGLIRQEVDGTVEVEIGYHVRRNLWGRGLAPEAAAGCRDYGFERLRAKRLISLIRPENLPSRRVAEKIGLSLWKMVDWRGLLHCVYVIRRESCPSGPVSASK